MNVVPNEFPACPRTPRVAIVGECPGEHECQRGRPFVGPAGKLLWSSLSQAGLSRHDCFVGNVCQHRAPKDNIQFLPWTHPHIQDGIAQLRADLERFDPDFVIVLGGTALRAATSEKHSISWAGTSTPVAWKGTLFESCSLTPRRVKHLALVHPAGVLRQDRFRFHWFALMDRVREEMVSRELTLPHRDIYIHTDADDAVSAMRALRGLRLAWDIEGYARTGISCMSLASSPWESHVFPFRLRDGTPIPAPAEALLWDEFRALLKSFPSVEPYHAPTRAYVMAGADGVRAGAPADASLLPLSSPGLMTWNGLYDSFVLAYRYNINPVHAIVHDGMVLHWELFAEVDKSLADATSWLTREPYYKSERGSDDPEVLWRYNGKDTCVTFECIEALLKRPECTPAALAHYAFNMSLLPPILYMELRGIAFDAAEQRRMAALCQRQVFALQGVLNRHVGMPFPPDGATLREHVRRYMCVKKPRTRREVPHTFKSGPRKGKTIVRKVSEPAKVDTMQDACQFALSPHLNALHSLRQILGGDWDSIATLPTAKRAQVSILLGCHFNINSPAANEYLYNTLGLPPQYIMENGRRTDRLAHDQSALLTLYMRSRREKKFAHAERPLRVWLTLSRCLTALETLAHGPDYDNRMRCSYNHVGPKTGRFSCSASAAEVGYNLQTVTKSHRHLFRADPGCRMGQWDLRGADGWTIAANCGALGDTGMLDDFAARIKPAQAVVLLMTQGERVNNLPREEVAALCAAIPDDWRYKAAKRVVWGTCYLMGVATMGSQITQDAFKDDGSFLVVEAADCRAIQEAVHKRYWGIAKWQERVRRQVLDDAHVVAASGHVRWFYGRRWEYKEDPITGHTYPVISRTLWGDALADCPQENTTFATKLALWRLWYDPENRLPTPSKVDGFSALRVEPLHTVHDSLLDQWAEADTDFAVSKHREWFSNPISIAGMPLTIPVSGEIGEDWSMKGAVKV